MKIQITALYCYPVKSLAGISQPWAHVEKRGLAYDRRWMLAGPDGRFISQREAPQLALLLPAFAGDALIIRHRRQGLEPLAIPLAPPEGIPAVEVQIWNDRCAALPVSRQADEWFSEALQRKCRLVYMPDETIRPLDAAYGQPGESVSFADSCPLLAIGEASLADLNQRLSMPVPMNRFRPNIVFSGSQPYEEEGWKGFRTGSAAFRGIRACGRCQITTIDQETAERGREPLRTLSAYRRQGHKILFGLYAGWIAGEGERPVVAAGEEVWVEKLLI